MNQLNLNLKVRGSVKIWDDTSSFAYVLNITKNEYQFIAYGTGNREIERVVLCRYPDKINKHYRLSKTSKILPTVNHTVFITISDIKSMGLRHAITQNIKNTFNVI